MVLGNAGGMNPLQANSARCVYGVSEGACGVPVGARRGLLSSGRAGAQTVFKLQRGLGECACHAWVGVLSWRGKGFFYASEVIKCHNFTTSTRYNQVHSCATPPCWALSDKPAS